MKEFNKKYLDIITEAHVIIKDLKPITKEVPSLEQVQASLLKLYKFSSWEEFIDTQQAGQCDKIAKAVCKLFPKVKMVSAYVNFSENAMLKINDNKENVAVHFFNKLGKNYVDFGKGTNRYNNVYILDGIDNLYNVTFSNEALKNIEDIKNEDPKAIGTMIR